MRLCVHPDDPPRDVLGLPRIVSCEEDIAWVLAAVDSPANGLTLCAGSLKANPANDVPAIARRFADRIWFAHLRNVRKEPDGSFEEAALSAGDTDMVALIKALLDEEARRRRAGCDLAQIPMRPDHGHELLADVGRGTSGLPLDRADAGFGRIARRGAFFGGRRVSGGAGRPSRPPGRH